MDSRKYIPAYGNPHAKLMILGEAPGYKEVELGKPFVGPSGRELDSLLKSAGIVRDYCWISNVSKYYVPPPASKGKKIPFHIRAKQVGIDIDEQLRDLQNEINSIKPNCILALGGSALWALAGTYKITNFRGSILHGMGCKFVPTFHPAHLLHSEGQEFKGYWNRQIMVLDFKRAYQQAAFPELVLPSRNLQICRSSAQLEDFIRRHKDHKHPSVDIEARGSCIPNCVGIAFTPHEGLTIPLWHTGEIEEIVKIPKFEMINMWIMLADFLAKHDIVGQNLKYDLDKIKRLGFVVKSVKSDTMLKAFAINPELPKSQAFNQSIYTEEPYYKDEGMYEGKLHELLIGCARDSCVNNELDGKMEKDIIELELQDFFYDFVMKFHDFYWEMENEGFIINEEVKKKLLEKYIRWSESLYYELFHLTEAYVNTRSPVQVYKLLFEILGLPRRDGTGEEELTALLNNQGKTGVRNERHRRVVEIILEKRRVDKTIDNYLMAMPDFDGKMKTTFFPCLKTGRSSTGQLEPPIRPIIEYRDEDNKKKKKSIGTSFQTLTKHGDIGDDVRSQYEPEKGYVFIQADKAQAEARVVFLLADDEQALRDIDEHDYHALTASWFFGGVEDDYSKKKLGYESAIRFAGKTLRHAGHLGARKRRAATSVNTDARKYKVYINKETKELLKITEAIAEHALNVFHAKQPKIQKVFHAGVIEALQRDKRYLIAPVPYGVNSRIGGKRQFFERWDEELFREAFSYLPQRAISDSTKADGMRLKKRILGLRIVMESHDALLFMVKERDVDDFAPIIKEEMERPIRFDTCSIPRRDLVVPCELEIGYNYQDLKKFKFLVPASQPQITQIPTPVTVPLTITDKFRMADMERKERWPHG